MQLNNRVFELAHGHYVREVYRKIWWAPESPFSMDETFDTSLLVDRDQFTNALRTIVLSCGKRASSASLRFEGGCLYICAGTTLAGLPAEGCWPWTVVTRYSWVYNLANKPVQSNPVRIFVDHGHVYAERFSCRCELPSDDSLLAPGTLAPNRKLAVQRAARALAPLMVSSSDIQQLIDEVATRTPAWREDERKVIAMVAKAWEALAPFGVQPEDFLNIFQRVTHDAWDTMTYVHQKNPNYWDQRRNRSGPKKPKNILDRVRRG